MTDSKRELIEPRLKLEGDICEILGQVYCNENNSGKQVDAIYCMDASEKIASFINAREQAINLSWQLKEIERLKEYKEREKALLDEVSELFAQPTDRITFPITRMGWVAFRTNALATIKRLRGTK